MKPLFVGHFCPNDCDRKGLPSPKSQGKAETREFILPKDKSRWRGTLVKAISEEHSWEVTPSETDPAESTCMVEWLANPQGFANRFWHDRSRPGWTWTGSYTLDADDDRWYIHFEKVSP